MIAEAHLSAALDRLRGESVHNRTPVLLGLSGAAFRKGDGNGGESGNHKDEQRKSAPRLAQDHTREHRWPRYSARLKRPLDGRPPWP